MSVLDPADQPPPWIISTAGPPDVVDDQYASSVWFGPLPYSMPYRHNTPTGAEQSAAEPDGEYGAVPAAGPATRPARADTANAATTRRSRSITHLRAREVRETGWVLAQGPSQFPA